MNKLERIQKLEDELKSLKEELNKPEFKKGDFVAVVGPSGSGKSTMMNLIGALDLATHGDIFLDNINIEHYKTLKK